MGPRPRGRGIAAPAAAPGPAPAGFNGAATARSRNWRSSADVSSDPSPLQWGRDRAVAEFPLPWSGCPCWLPALQWGRDRAVAEFTLACGGYRREPRFNGAATARSRNCSLPSAVSGELGWLQWGRDRAVAELQMAQQAQAAQQALQWGRDRAVAELPVSIMLEGSLLVASMGPRPRGRGINYSLWWCNYISTLQWGRDRAVAEL